MASTIIFFYIQEFKSFERNKSNAGLQYSEVSRVRLYMIRHIVHIYKGFSSLFLDITSIYVTLELFEIQYKFQMNKKTSEKVRTQKIDKKTKTKTICYT